MSALFPFIATVITISLTGGVAHAARPTKVLLKREALKNYFEIQHMLIGHEPYFRSTLDYDLFKDAEFNHKVSINADYQRGGLNFTEKEIDIFTMGLGVLF